MITKLSFLFVLFCLLGPLPHLCSQLSEEATISIWTCRQGDEVYNTFGHTAIKVEDPVTARFEIYNYGLFNDEDPLFLPNFLKGRLLYWLGIQSKQGFTSNYSFEKRSVFEQVLRLNTQQKNTIYLKLRDNFKKENRKYLYDFFFDNCSTRPRDLILSDLENVTDAEVAAPNKTYRQLLDEFTYAKPWMDFGIDLIIGRVADDIATKNDQMFLPEYLFKRIENTRVNGIPLVLETNIILDYEKEHQSRQVKTFFTPAILFGLILLIELLLFLYFFKRKMNGLVKFYDGLWFFVLSISSIIILFMWFGTDHDPTKQNLNALWMSPLFFILLFSKRKWVFYALFLSLGTSLITATFIQQYHVASLMIISIIILKLVRQFRDRWGSDKGQNVKEEII